MTTSWPSTAPKRRRERNAKLTRKASPFALWTGEAVLLALVDKMRQANLAPGAEQPWYAQNECIHHGARINSLFGASSHCRPDPRLRPAALGWLGSAGGFPLVHLRLLQPRGS